MGETFCAQTPAEFIGDSPVTRAMLERARAMATREATLLIHGETGSGKGALARFIHHHSRRREGPFVVADCSSLSSTLLESQLFGHVRGAFSGAQFDNIGFARAASGGTLFLDEIGELPLPLQSKLLTLLQDREVVPVGDVRPVRVDVRILCATNRDLVSMVRAGEFREDLYYRVSVLSVRVEPLRHRRADIIPLAKHFLRRLFEVYQENDRPLSESALRTLLDHHWPGNVRELANVVELSHALSSGNEIDVVLPVTKVDSRPSDLQVEPELNVDCVIRRLIGTALRRTQFNRSAAARLLGLERRRLARLMKKLGVNRV